MNKGPLFQKLRKYLKSIDKKWVAPKNIKRHDMYVFVRKDKYGRNLIKIRSIGEDKYKVSSIKFSYYKSKGPKGWCVGWKKPSGESFTWLKGRPAVYTFNAEENRIINTTYMRREATWNQVYNLFLIANNLTHEEYRQRTCPVLKDFPEFPLCKELKYGHIGEVFKVHKVRGKKLRQWVMSSEPSRGINIGNKLALCKKLHKVDVNILHNYIHIIDKYLRITPNIMSLGAFNTTATFERMIRDLELKDSRYRNMFTDLYRLVFKYKKVCKGQKLPKAITIEQFHNDLHLAIMEKEDANFCTPYVYTKAENSILEIKQINGYEIKLPSCNKDLTLWGDLQNHCIGGYPREPKARILLSIWKEESIVSCMELIPERQIIEVDGRRQNVSMYSSQASNTWKINQHRGQHNKEPKMSEKDKQAIESAILSVINKEKAVENEKVLC